MIRLTEESASLPVSPVYLFDEEWLHHNPRLHGLHLALKTHCTASYLPENGLLLYQVYSYCDTTLKSHWRRAAMPFAGLQSRG